MCLPCRSVALLVTAAVSTLAQSATLRVCADPNNLPYSNEQQQGFENKLADLVATKLNATLEYTWWSQRESFATKSLNQGACEVILGVPTSLPDILTTKPYYRSTYVFVSRRDRSLRITSLADARLSNLRIGIHFTDDSYAPPAFALAHRGIMQNVVAFKLFGEYGEANPARKLIDAVESGAVDVAIAWGPFAGYFAQGAAVPLDITPVTPSTFMGVPFAYDISAGVRKGNGALKTELDQILQAESTAVHRILNQYAVPQVPEPE